MSLAIGNTNVPPKGEELRAIQPAVSIYGSARTPENHPDYEFTLRLARKLSDAGFSVISGGGPGIVESLQILTLRRPLVT